MTARRLNRPGALVALRELTTESQTMTSGANGQQGTMALPSVSGYTFVGVLDTECSAWQLPITKTFATATKWYWAVNNPNGWSGSYTVHVRLLYVRDDAI